MNAIAASVDDALGNAFMIEVKDLLAGDMVFQELRTARTGAEPVLVIGNRRALRGGQDIIFTLGFLMGGTALGQVKFVRHAHSPIWLEFVKPTKNAGFGCEYEE